MLTGTVYTLAPMGAPLVAFDRHKRTRMIVAMASLAAFLTSSRAPAVAGEIESPHFQKGLWNFQRTIERLRPSPDPNLLLAREDVTRCVDPSLAMKAIFASPRVGNCNTAKPELVGNRFVFPVRCDFMGPVRTEITVESDVSYTETNLLTAGNFPRKDTVVARRVGDCAVPITGLNSQTPKPRQKIDRGTQAP